MKKLFSREEVDQLYAAAEKLGLQAESWEFDLSGEWADRHSPTDILNFIFAEAGLVEEDYTYDSSYESHQLFSGLLDTYCEQQVDEYDS